MLGLPTHVGIDKKKAAAAVLALATQYGPGVLTKVQNYLTPKFAHEKRSNPRQKNFKVVTAPVARTTQYKPSAPNFKSTRTGDITIDHMEPLGPLYGNAATNTGAGSYELNPGLIETFKWLSRVAILYEYYTVNKLEIIYKNKTATSTPGNVVLGIDYDASGVVPESTQELEAYLCSKNCSPWQDTTLSCQPKDLKRFQNRLVRDIDELTQTDDDRRLTDFGRFFVMTEDNNTTDKIGNLYVKYNITFHTPRGVRRAHALYADFVGSVAGRASALPFGSTPGTNTTTVGVTMSATNGNETTFARPGLYYFVLVIDGTTIVTPTSSIFCLPQGGAATASTESSINAGATKCIALGFIDILDRNQKVQWVVGAFASITAIDVQIFEANTIPVAALAKLLEKQMEAPVPTVFSTPKIVSKSRDDEEEYTVLHR